MATEIQDKEPPHCIAYGLLKPSTVS